MVGCIISGNTNLYQGGGARADGGTVNFIDCTISDNTSMQRGGGVSCRDATFTNCTISDNYAIHEGGGVSFRNGVTATFTDCTINGNSGSNSGTPTLGGGGIALYNSSGTLSYCTVFDNFSPEYGGGIATLSGNLSLDHCTIFANETYDSRSGISIVSGGTADITNSIISHNYSGYGIHNSGTITVGYSDFYGNVAGDMTGNVPSGFGVLDRVNLNGDSCDCYYDIFVDPMYADTAGRDLHLTEFSPCIDAGDPAFPYDPDGTITDMGRYYFNQTGIQESTAPIPTGGILMISPCPCSGLLTISFNVKGETATVIEIYDLHGRLLEKMDSVTSIGEMHYDTSGLSAGIYFCRLESGNEVENGTFVVLR